MKLVLMIINLIILETKKDVNQDILFLKLDFKTDYDFI